MRYAAKFGRLPSSLLFTAILLYGTAGVIPQAIGIECGDFLTSGVYSLNRDLACDGPGDPAISLGSGARLDLGNHTITCNDSDREGIVLLGTNAVVRDGVVKGCRNGVVITDSGNHNTVVRIEASNNERQGFNIEGHSNRVRYGLAKSNGREGFGIEGDSNNVVRSSAESNDREGFSIEGDSNRVTHSSAEFNGRDGMNISGSANRLVGNESRGNERRGFNIDEGESNRLLSCLAEYNGRQGIIIDEGNDNRVANCTASHSCRDGIEIDGNGQRNRLVNNLVTFNGDKDTCGGAGEVHRPWFYAGIDITEGAVDNDVIGNKTSNNKGCGTLNFESCDSEGVRDRNLWDENPDGSTPPQCVSNQWRVNRADGERAEPECGQIPVE